MTLENLFGVADKRLVDVVRPGSRRVSLPWWIFVLVAIGTAPVAGRSLGLLGRQAPLEWLGLGVAALAVAVFASRLDERTFANLRRRPLPLRVAVAAGTVIGGVAVSRFMVGHLAGLSPLVLQLALLALVFILWTASAALGGGVILLVDRLLRGLVGDFRHRIGLAVFSLLGASFVLCGYVAVRAAGIVEALTLRGTAGLVPPFLGYAVRDLPFVQPLLARPAMFPVAAFFVAAVAFFPALLSASAKLAENVTERITPLMKAFARVADGDRNVHLEEAGDDQFVNVALSFNEMVDQLYFGQRIERAFGQYVSTEVLERIRAQRGSVCLPAELRIASVFFADIRGFTPMAERLAPDLVVGLLNRYFEQVIPLIERYHGFLNKFVGDAVVVVFNGPIDQPDHAQRAALCGVALQQLITELNAKNFFAEVGSLQIGVGVATGPMLCGNIGAHSRQEYTVIGDTVNLASRMTGHAHGGEVWVSEATAALLPAALGAAPAEPIKFKGKDNAVVPYCVWPPAPVELPAAALVIAPQRSASYAS